MNILKHKILLYGFFVFIANFAYSSASLSQVPLSTASECVQGLEQELATERGRVTLGRDILELHIARTALQHWGYELDPDFQRTFADGYQIFQTAMREQNFPSVEDAEREENEEDFSLMLSAQDEQFDQFQGFLNTAREEFPAYNVFELADQQIVRRQCQYSVILWNQNRDFWIDAAMFWSIFIPFSEGP